MWPVSGPVRDRSLIMGSGDYKTGGRGVGQVLPLQKVGAEKVLAKLKGRKTIFESISIWDT